MKYLNLVRSKRASDTCYGEYGCFTTGSPFGIKYFYLIILIHMFKIGGTLQRPFALLPQSV